MRSVRVGEGKAPLLEVVQDTIAKNKQALVFVNSRRSAEKAAEDIAIKLKVKDVRFDALAEDVLGVLGRPTDQCERLAKCIKKGVAFHHAGLHPRQKELVEDAFRAGVIKIIGCTPTLAAGIDVPAFRAIIRDVKRYGSHGLSDIPVLEYLQMAGRAGRPKFDTFGESILIAVNEGEKNRVWDKYVHGLPESIYSKLAVEPVLRTYVLSLSTMKTVSTLTELFDFFGRTFWAHQYRDMASLEKKIIQVVTLLVNWDFLIEEPTGLHATPLGERVAKLYIDPLTAHQLIKGLQKATGRVIKPLSWLHLVCNALEMRPLLRMKIGEYEELQSTLAANDAYLLEGEPSMFETGYDEYLNAMKTASMLLNWVDEKDEQFLLERFDCRPGETKAKLETADWLLYSTHELARLTGNLDVLTEITKIRVRLKYGVREELLPLVRLKNIGRVRARRLFSEGIRTLGDVRSVDTGKLSAILGAQVAANVKAQIGQDVVDEELNVPRLRDRQKRLDE